MINDLRTAFAFLTILPARHQKASQPGRSFAYFPLVGLVIGSILAGVSFLFQQWPRDLVAFFLLLLWVVLTGGLHLDGFADSCDGLLATTEASRRLDIMKDPRLGTWAVIGLIFLLLGKWIALQAVAPELLILTPVLGRWSMVLAAYFFPYARSSGLGAYFREGLQHQQVILASITVLLIAVFCAIVSGDMRTPLGLSIPPLMTGVLGSWATRRLGGGLTGDVYGAVCEITEFTVLLVFMGLR